MTSEQEYREMLSSVSRSYDWFVDVTLAFIEQCGIGDQLKSYIDGHPGVSASDVIKETHRLVFGIEIR